MVTTSKRNDATRRRSPLTKALATLAVGLPLTLGSCAVGAGDFTIDGAAPNTTDPAPANAAPAPAPPEEAPAADAPAYQGQGTIWAGVSYSPAKAQEALANLPEAAPDTMYGYTRDAYPHWESGQAHGWETPVPGRKCNVRAATLLRDGEQIEVNDNCTVTSGVWAGPYDGLPIYTPKEMDADHMVPLADSWRTGAQSWTEDQRAAFANSPLVVLATESGANQTKGDSHPGEWKPELRDAWCGYAVRWIEIKDTFGLRLSNENPAGLGQNERAGLQEMLDTCE